MRHIACLADDKTEVTKRANENRIALEIIYLNPSEEKSRSWSSRKLSGGDGECLCRSYLGMRALCLKRNEKRVFLVVRIRRCAKRERHKTGLQKVAISAIPNRTKHLIVGADII